MHCGEVGRGFVGRRIVHFGEVGRGIVHCGEVGREITSGL